MTKVSGITKSVVAQNSKCLATKGRLIFRIPLEVTLLGVYLDGSSPLTRASVGCIILPLCKPVDYMYFENGYTLGFAAATSYYGGDFTKDEAVLELKEFVVGKLLPEWDKLAEVEQCIEFLLSLPSYKARDDGYLIESLVCLSAYQQTYERCLNFIHDWREYLLTESGARVLARPNSSFESQQMVIEVVETCIKSQNYELLRENLDKWYQQSLTKLGLTKFTKFKISN